MKFKDAYKAANDSVHVRPELLEQIKYQQAKAQTEAPEKRQRRRAWWIAIPTAATATALACFAVFLGMRTLRSSAPKAADASNEIMYTGKSEEAMASEPLRFDSSASLLSFTSYEEIAECLTQRNIEYAYRYGYKSSMGIATESADFAVPDAPTAPDVPAEIPNPVSQEFSSNTMLNGGADTITITDDGQMPKPTEGTRSETGTNVQVQGVDEADIVKTDGTWIYCLNRETNKLYAVKADGKDAKITASAKLPEAKESEYLEFNEMILSNDRLYVIGTAYNWMASDADTQNTMIVVYALGDRTELKMVDTLKQQGSYRTSRLIGNTLVTVSCKQFWYSYFKTDLEISTWCPAVTDDGETKLLEPDELYINEHSDENAYVLITTIDTQTGTQFDSHKAIFGGSDVVYCNEDKLLIASSEYENTRSDEQTTADGRHFVKDVSRQYTSLSLFDLSGGSITPIATQKVEGTLLNQFSMDAYDGTYRLVVTRSGYEQTIWTDGIDTYEYEELRDCALYVLDEKLEPIGSLTELAENEMVQSVRFMGSIAYFVTFRQTDPLFAVDLGDPTQPKILSALKIPGFSAYLHPFGEGRLLGIGYSADEKTGVTDGVKLTLFDISDPGDVKVLVTQKVNASYTTVQNNHKAIFTDVQNGLVAFPADNLYFVFRVSDDGIKQRGAIDLGDSYWWDGSARGVALNDAFYVVTSEAVVVLSFETMQKLKEVKFQ